MPTTKAPERKRAPARWPPTKRTENAIANAATAWSLGNEGSGDGGATSSVCDGGAPNGRSRNQTWETTWLRSRPRPAESSPDRHAIFHLYGPRGRSKSQRAKVARRQRG